MRPYFEDPAGITIYHGDCLEILPKLEAVDHVITDPPYSEHVHKNNMRGLTAWQGDISAHRELGFGHLDRDTLRLSAACVARIVKRWALVFSDVESRHLWEEALGPMEYVRTGAWIKGNGAPQFTGDRPAVGFEAITICHAPGKKRWNGGGAPGVWYHNIVMNRRHDGLSERLHTTQKPLPLMRELVRLFSDPAEIVLDPFMGSGTTLRAAKDLGRRAIGIEIEEKYCEIAAKRLNQGVLFGSERMA